jgi:hypothetical protein
VDVLEAASLVVEKILGMSVAKDVAADRHFVVVYVESFLAVSEEEIDLGHSVKLSLVGPAEDDVGHLAAAQRLGGSLTEDPSDGVDDVGLAAAIWTDDGGDSLVEIEIGFVGEGLESLEMERLQIHEWWSREGGSGSAIGTKADYGKPKEAIPLHMVAKKDLIYNI